MVCVSLKRTCNPGPFSAFTSCLPWSDRFPHWGIFILMFLFATGRKEMMKQWTWNLWELGASPWKASHHITRQDHTPTSSGKHTAVLTCALPAFWQICVHIHVWGASMDTYMPPCTHIYTQGWLSLPVKSVCSLSSLEGDDWSFYCLCEEIHTAHP